MALEDEQGQLLISGDMLLPSISTNVSVYAQEPEGNPLQWFLDSLERMAHVPDSTLVLPAHGRPFRGALARVRQLQAHHEDRLQALMQLCRTRAVCAHDALPILFRRDLNLHQTTFAMGEAIAHLHALWHRGDVRREPDNEGVLRFRAA
jgi:glyoxylase-like metal-dependent hydrolase (beta-lactamase superfamily II)